MEKLKEKSVFNLDAADLLIKNTLYASSIHCSYYAAHQFMVSKLGQIKGLTYDGLSALINASKTGPQASKLGSHQFVIKEIKDAVKPKMNNKDYFTLTNIITDLKLLREEADYHDVSINDVKANTSRKYSKQIIDDITQATK